MNDSITSQKNNIRPPYPPVITAQDLIPTDISSNKVESVRIPNAFIAYRMALVRQLKSQKVACHRSNVSSLASRLWSEEPEDVKNTYRKMATDAQMLHNQARGLTFLSYEQSTSSDNVMQDEVNSENINNSTQDIEAELLALLNLQSLQIQPALPQGNPVITSPMYFDNNPPTTTSVSGSFDHYNNFGNNYNGNFIGNMASKGVYERHLEQRIQVLEQQMALFYQLYYGVV